jgi:hypothetical protein
MSLKNIQCTCPDCGTEFSLDRAFGEQALAKVQAEISQMNDEQIQARVDAAARLAIEEGKKQAREQMLKDAKAQTKELDETRDKLTSLELEKLALEAERSRLANSQQTAINLALKKQEIEMDTKQNQKVQQLQLQISTLQSDLADASRRAQQGSMQAQGEASELLIEDTLKSLFPIDDLTEVKKGASGADCILTVKNLTGRAVGKINIEVKQTKNFSKDWVTKLKNDSLAIGANFSVLITNAWPSDNNKAHIRDGVWICGFSEYQILITALRNSLIEISKVVATEEVREEKAQVMFDFLTSQEFAGTIEQMIRPIVRMQEQLEKEKKALTGVWNEREKLIQSSISGAESLYFKIQGIAQVNLPHVAGIENFDTLSLEQNALESVKET